MNEDHQDVKHLKDAIRAASDKKILLYCAASDTKTTSKSNEPYFPGKLGEVDAIGAADWDHRRKPYVGADARFLFPGDYVLHDQNMVPVAEGGNSAATALASALVALVLFCLKKDGQPFGGEIRSSMSRLFTSLAYVDTKFSSFVDNRDLLQVNEDGTGATYQAVASRCKIYFASRTNSKEEVLSK